MEWLNSLTSMAETKPVLYLVTMVFVSVIIMTLCFFIYKIIKLISEKISSVKIGKAEVGLRTESINNIEVEDITSKKEINMRSLINLIRELPETAIAYNNKINEIKRQLIEDQLQKFKAELRNYKKSIRETYCELINIDLNSDKSKLFSYWFESLFDEVDLEINAVLIRNGLIEKTAEQLEDTLRKLYEESYAVIIEGTENAPSFITNPMGLREIVNDKRNDYKKFLDLSLNHAKKLRVDAEEKFIKAKEDYEKAQFEIIKIDFPEYAERLKENVG